MTCWRGSPEPEALRVDHVAALHRADELHQGGHFQAAANEYRHALHADPSLFRAWYGLGCACLSLYAYGDAVVALRRAVALNPHAIAARCNLAEALFQLGEADEAAAEYGRAADGGDPEARSIALSALACIAPGCPGLDHAAIQAVRRLWVASIGNDINADACATRELREKLRIGYISAFFGARNWMKPVWGVINRHDRARFEVHLLSDGADPTESSGYQDFADDRIWRIGGLSNAELAGRIRDAGLDVLVDLNGYSRQLRLGLFLHRPAPLQIAWFNMYATSGLSGFDMLIGDAAVAAVEEEQHYCERIVRVPGSYLAFDVLYPVPDVAPPPVLRNGWLTFGSFASAHKITDPVVAAWSRILLGVPNARLLVRNQLMNEPSNRLALIGRFARQGVAPDRLILREGAEHFEFLRGYDEVDIALDTFPYNGGTTTTEALWQGVPVLSFNGDRWASRTSRSLLLAAGLPEWVATDQADFVRRGVALALNEGTPALLAALRTGLREWLRSSAACDAAGLCGALEAIYAAGAGR
jgi:predicted O-linked N-acetylglucosamine transferase (SPINDLY family)